MSAAALALLLVAALTHALWNIVAKRSGGDTRFALMTVLLMIVIWAPVGAWAALGVLPSWGQLEWAVLLASAMHASITLLHTYEIPDGMMGIVPGAHADEDLAAGRALAQQRTGEIVHALAARGFPDVKTLLAAGASAAQAILDHAREGSFDLIVMGTHGRTGLARAFAGSIAEVVVRKATCPVLTVHMPVLP